MTKLELNECFAVQGAQCITVTGSGGKTSLIQYLAQKHRCLKTLITTTTKIGTDQGWLYDYFWLYSDKNKNFPKPSCGITLAGAADESNEKLVSLPQDLLAELVSRFDYTLIEGDGSRTLPLKAWSEYEPVVPSYTTITIGVIPLSVLGMPVSENTVHRLPLFTKLTGAVTGDILTLQHFVNIITGAFGKGLFSSACGARILFFNQVESDTALFNAESLVSMFPAKCLSSMDRIIAGSVRQESGFTLWSK